MPSRRSFLAAALGGGAVATAGAAPGGGVAAAGALGGGGVALAGAAGPVRREAGVEAEIRRRALHYASQRYLTVDYYRIRRRLAFPLPIGKLAIPEAPVPSISDYPWATWMTWELEERVNALGWAAECFGEEAFAAAAARDLAALAGWPGWRQYGTPDLSSAHAGRLLWTACRKWRWPSAALRERIRAACARHAEDLLPLCRKHYGAVASARDALALPVAKLHNIPLIATAAAALTAGAAGHAAAAELNRTVGAIFGAILELRSGGYSEGVAYDGYVLDFLADWLGELPAADRAAIQEHRCFAHYLEQSWMLGAPGAMADVAELSDVEAREMPFHFSAQAKLLAFGPRPERAWLARQWPVSRMRADALGALAAAGRPEGAAPPAGALDAHYAAVLRTGYGAGDTAVAVSCSNSPMGHIHRDGGSLVIGRRGRWILSDPGYQQYMRDAERTFTLGPAAHNYPVVNGAVQARNAAKRLALDAPERGLLRVSVDLTAGYGPEAAAESVVRTVWLAGRDLVVVADRIRCAVPPTVDYHWHGHPEAAWHARGGWLLLHLPDAGLWFHSPQAALGEASIERLEGSRGQLTAGARIAPAPETVWWVFALAAAPPAVATGPGGRSLTAAGRRFTV